MLTDMNIIIKHPFGNWHPPLNNEKNKNRKKNIKQKQIGCGTSWYDKV
jgi:hypothetical protein